MRARNVVTGVVAVAVLAGAGFVIAGLLDAELPNPFAKPMCTVTGTDGSAIKVDPTQASNAATIAAVGAKMDISERGVVVALATAYQESRLENIEHGDRDSLGLFQQRPSQGWGTEEQIQDPRYSSKRFFKALKKIEGWEDMRVTEAAQAVQRSAYPEAYEQWADESQVLAEAMLGSVNAAVACKIDDKGKTGDDAIHAVKSELSLDWDGVKPESDGTTIKMSDVGNGWQFAHWMVAYSEDLGVSSVVYDGHEWSAKSGEWEESDNAAGKSVTVKVRAKA
ncbi:hypothetical protein [Phytomonospora endophytica]|uniref:Heavy metal transporter n=1 Tax=Phytomonospora endophytica TaxID=714109 RepID=A0A841FGE1_9ACTN|nr:hypothetical protein [Phytomonospora endophytica]MBB6034063.1 hypothetical protein [Phytomonospora endophytica]GIG66457.1 hypothetical protein Pen01_27520 [Phytomonospora endophytica]